MLKACMKLLNSPKDMKIGNHSAVKTDRFEKYFYYDTCIYKILFDTKEIIIDDGGYKTYSTTRAINSYKNSLKHQWKTESGYKVIDNRTK